MKLTPFSRYKISGHSMEPTLKNGQVVWVNNWPYLINKIRVGDIVIFEQDGKELIKRVAKINGKSVSLMGDNRSDSLDSRTFGEVNIEKISGKIITNK